MSTEPATTHDDIELAPGDWTLVRKLAPYLRPDALLYVVAFVLAPVSAALTVVQPLLLKTVIDDYVVPGNLNGLQTAALLYLAAVVAAFATEASYTVALSHAASRTIARLRDRIYQHSLSLAQSFFDRVPTGRLLTRATSDVDALGETLTAGAITIVLDMLLVVGILVGMFALDAKLTLVLLLVGPPLALAIELIRRKLRNLYNIVRTSLAELNAYLAERLNGVQVVQLYADEERALRGFDERLYRYRDATVSTNIWDALMYALVDGLANVTMALMLWYGSGGILEGVATAGLLAAFIDYIGKLFQPVREFSAKVAIIQRATSALEKIFGLLDHREQIPDGTQPLEGELESVVLEDVSFAYGEGPDVLRGVSLEVRPGEVVALVGRTGSGKSTIGKLLIRAYQGYRGSIRINGRELSELQRDAVRRMIGMVHQDVVLFPGDVRFNVALGADIPDAELEEAIRIVHAQRAIERLGGLDGRVEHGGRNLSVGEGQLLAFARTMAHDPPMVILDEATASVDTLTEAAIQQATEAVLARKTVLVIAHRLSTIIHADRIVVMEAGQVVEVGSHAELLERGGRYADLFQKQFGEELEDDDRELSAG